MSAEAMEAYLKAQKQGQKYYKTAVNRGEYPYPPVLDDLLNSSQVAGYAELGLVEIPAELITGTKSAGRTFALAGNFLPLLEANSEFAMKWTHLYDAQIGDEGIRDPIKCYEYLGRFYVQEGNKRVSVLKSLSAPTIAGTVTRVLPPPWSEDEEVRTYYDFLRFYELSGLYGVSFRNGGDYARLQAALGFEEDHVWTAEERRSFSSGFTRFKAVFDAVRGTAPVSAAEALLVWLGVFSFPELKDLTQTELKRDLLQLWPDVMATIESDPIELKTEPDADDTGLISRLMGVTRPDHLNVAFLYGFDPKVSAWTHAHDKGRAYLEAHLGDKVAVKTYRTFDDDDFYPAMEAAVEDGAQLLFATTPSMIAACRKLAVAHSEVKILNCSLSQPYKGLRTYYSRIHECKFITGAIAGAMAENDLVGYVSNYPIFGTPASINAFALGVRLTNPRARVKLVWSCTEGDPIQALEEMGVRVISNRDTVGSHHDARVLEWGTYKLLPDGRSQPLAGPSWNWGRLYEQIVKSVFSGAWDHASENKAINYWWGLDSGVIDVQLDKALPDGVRSLAQMLRNGVMGGTVEPFHTRILDQAGFLRNDGSRSFSHEEILAMDWLCDNVDGTIPGFDELLPQARDTVRHMGLYRDELPPEKEEVKQL